MKLSREAQYAVRAVLDLAQRSPARVEDIAARQGIPPAFAARVVRHLARSGLVRTRRGSRGGVGLARSPESISLLDVVTAAEGPPALNQCVAWEDCPCAQPCPVRAAFARLQKVVEQELDGVTVAALAGQLPAAAGGPRRARHRRDTQPIENRGGGR